MKGERERKTEKCYAQIRKKRGRRERAKLKYPNEKTLGILCKKKRKTFDLVFFSGEEKVHRSNSAQ